MVDHIDAKQVQEILENDKGVVMDVLSKKSYESRHIPGAVNVPVDEPAFEERAKEAAPDKQQPVVAYCSDRECQLSPKAAEKLEEMGYENVKEFDEGLQGWKEAGLDFEGQPKQIRAEGS